MTSVLLVRLSAMGDVVQSLGAVRALRAARPDWRLTFVTQTEHAPLLDEPGLVDRIVAFDRGGGLAAVRALGPIKVEAGRDALRDQVVKGEIRAIRIAAARQLQEHDAKSSASSIGRNLKRYKKDDRIAPIEALGIIGTDDAVSALEREMKAPDWEHRAAAARALARLGSGEDGLVHGLKDKEEMLAAVALARIDTDRAREEVLDYLEKSRGDKDSYLIRRVGRGGAGADAEAFAKALEARLQKTKSPDVLLEAAWHGRLAACAEAALKYVDHRDPLVQAWAFRVAGLGAKPLEEALVDDGLKSRDRRVRYAAAEAFIAAAGEEGRVAALRKLMAHKEGDVAMVGVRHAVEGRIKELLDDLAAVAQGETGAKKDWELRTAAAVGLGRVGHDRDLAVLEGLAGSRDWWLKAGALEGLYHTYRKEAIPHLIDAFDDRHPVVRMTARRNLRLMSQQVFLKKSQYEDWWEKAKERLELVHPEKTIEQLDKYGYATRKQIQEVLKGTDIVAIKGRWDKVELILQDLEVTHQAIRAQEIKVYGVSPKQVVLVNCEGSVDSETTKYLQWMVVAGGYMATTDWSLVNATTRTFPDIVKGYTKQSTGNDVVIVEPSDPAHVRVQGAFPEDVDLMWWLEIQAFPIAIEDPIRAEVIVDSLEMLTRYGSSAMMVEFPAGLGKVLHSTSHFYLQKEGFAHASDVRERMIFAVDHLGLSVEEVRELAGKGAFGNIDNTTPISKSYSMFQLLVSFIDEKRRSDLRR